MDYRKSSFKPPTVGGGGGGGGAIISRTFQGGGNREWELTWEGGLDQLREIGDHTAF